MISSWVNKEYLNKDFKLTFKKSWPDCHVVLHNFFQKKISKVRASLLKQKFHEFNSDLFQFEQTDDCKNLESREIKEFYNFFKSKEFLSLISNMTGIKVSSIDMSGFIYDSTDYLLPHDDKLEGRKLAYVINLSKNFKEEDGGQLEVFKNSKVSKSYSPVFNSLVVFKVTPNSVHQVREVLSSKKRISLTGWFHG